MKDFPVLFFNLLCSVNSNPSPADPPQGKGVYWLLQMFHKCHRPAYLSFNHFLFFSAVSSKQKLGEEYTQAQQSLNELYKYRLRKIHFLNFTNAYNYLTPDTCKRTLKLAALLKHAI